MYLMIENAGVAPEEGMMMFGVSVGKGDIGQFGSGAKHGIMTLMRMGIEVIVYLGEKKLEFYTKPITVKGEKLQQMCCNGQELSFTLNFGDLDWNQAQMSIREFVSNAIDESPEDWKVGTSETAFGVEGYTRVFVEFNAEIKRVYAQLSTVFLHIDGREGESIIEKAVPTPCKFYRKGVLIRELKKLSLFDYNFDFPIDESRNSDEYVLAGHAPRLAIAGYNQDQWLYLFRKAVLERFECVEKDFYLSDVASRSVPWQWGPITTNQTIVDLMGCGHVIPMNWYRWLKKCGVQSDNNALTHWTEGFAGEDWGESELFDKLWEMFCWVGPDTKQKPTLIKFKDATYKTKGMLKDGKVWLNDQLQGVELAKTMLEEIVHHLTGAYDGSREMQEAFLTIILHEIRDRIGLVSN